MWCVYLQILEESDTSLMLSLNHPLPSVRNMAVNYLKEIFTSQHVCSHQHEIKNEHCFFLYMHYSDH